MAQIKCAPALLRRTRPLEKTTLTFPDYFKRALPFLLLSTYGIFLCSYFIFDDYSDPYRFFARVLFVFGIFVFAQGMRNIWRQPLFQITGLYMLYLLLSGFWSSPMEWFRLGQKLTISVYLLSFLAITQFLVQWNRGLFERMLQLCVLIAGVTAVVSILVFYSENPFPGTRLDGIGALTNVNIFANVYGIFALLGMGFALQAPPGPLKGLLLAAVGVFICFAWFGQSRTAFVSMLIGLSTLAGLMLEERKILYAAILAALAVTLTLLFPDVVEQALLRGKGLRPLIWTEVWAEAKSAPIFGHGLISEISVVSGETVFETVHNAYLQVFWQGGLVGLCLFLALLGLAFRNAWTWGFQQRDYTVFCMLLFTACTMMTGVDTLIARPRDQWMLFWLPLAILLAYQSIARTPDTINSSERLN